MRLSISLFILALFLLFQYNYSRADEWFGSYGVGVFHDSNYYLGQNKYGELGYRYFFTPGWYIQSKAAYWGEGSPDQNRHSSAMWAEGIGLEEDFQPLEIRSGWGLAAISNPDSQLGGRFPQFNGNLSIGLRDKYQDGIALEYQHVSSAGLVMPNAGRDFLVIELSRKW